MEAARVAVEAWDYECCLCGFPREENAVMWCYYCGATTDPRSATVWMPRAALRRLQQSEADQRTLQERYQHLLLRAEEQVAELAELRCQLQAREPTCQHCGSAGVPGGCDDCGREVRDGD